jgi:hypothetical protein
MRALVLVVLLCGCHDFDKFYAELSDLGGDLGAPDLLPPNYDLSGDQGVVCPVPVGGLPAGCMTFSSLSDPVVPLMQNDEMITQDPTCGMIRLTVPGAAPHDLWWDDTSAAAVVAVPQVTMSTFRVEALIHANLTNVQQFVGIFLVDTATGRYFFTEASFDGLPADAGLQHKVAAFTMGDESSVANYENAPIQPAPSYHFTIAYQGFSTWAEHTNDTFTTQAPTLAAPLTFGVVAGNSALGTTIPNIPPVTAYVEWMAICPP